MKTWLAKTLPRLDALKKLSVDSLPAVANLFCDKLGIEDETERGTVRMLVNGLILITLLTAGAWYFTD